MTQQEASGMTDGLSIASGPGKTLFPPLWIDDKERLFYVWRFHRRHAFPGRIHKSRLKEAKQDVRGFSELESFSKDDERKKNKGIGCLSNNIDLS